MDELVKDKGFYRGPKKEWEYEMYGFYPRGLGDLIYNTLRKIIEDDDKSPWAYAAFDKCTVLLIQGKRWPDELSPEIVNHFSILRWATKNMYKWGWIKRALPRTQRSMTRDPWIMYYAACIHLNKRDFIYLLPQWKLYRPLLWNLRKALIGEKNNYLFWNKVSDFMAMIFKRKDFVKVLHKYMEWAYERKNIV